MLKMFSSRVIMLLLHVILMIKTCYTSKILITGVQMKSHMFDQLTVAEELVSRGHDVYYGVAARYGGIADIEKKGIKVITYKMPLDVPYMGSDDAEKLTTGLIFDKIDIAERMKRGAANHPLIVVKNYCDYMMHDEAFLEQLRKLDLDIALVEAFILCPCTIILPKHLGIPFVTMAAYYFPWSIRIPALPSFYPTGSLTTNRNSLSFKERLGTLLVYLVFQFDRFVDWDSDVSLLSKYTVGVSSWKDLLLEAELFIITNDHLIDRPMPLMPNFIRLSGLSCKPSKPLPRDLDSIMNSSAEGVVVMTFGSSITSIPEDIVQKFLDAFGKLKHTVVAKLRVPDGWTIPNNVHVLPWLPQNDILGHPNTRLFITHCGSGGQYEALYHGVPMLSCPLFAEQHVNAQKAFEKGFGLILDIHNFTSTQLFNNIQEMLTNPSYTTAIRKMSAVLHDEPMNSREKASFWIEHVIKHGGKHLRSIAMDMPVYQFLMIDVIALVFIILLLSFVLLTLIIYCVIKKLYAKRIVKADKKKKQ